MLSFISRRLGFLILTLLLTSILIFVITNYLPGDVCRIIMGREAAESALETCREERGLNDPAVVQYLRWLTDFVQGDWGTSLDGQVEIRPMVMERLRNSMRLGALTLLIAVPLAIALGVIAGLNRDKFVDNAVSVGALTFVGLPEFVTGLVLIQLFAFTINDWLDGAFGIRPFLANSSVEPGASFLDALPSLILPALTATLVLLAYIARLTRAGVVEELKQTYVRTASLKGLPRRVVVVKHVLRNALLPTIAVVAISIGWLISGLIVIENVFNYPGLGRLMVYAIDRRDIPTLQAITMITVLVFALANLSADLLSAWLNPRIRLK
ncbi:MAG: ABC transporter permease [Candidatus Promineifilaceae bacterium]|jgi:peptide/nickel transport system permease protein